MVVDLPPIPQEVKPLAHYLKLADEHDERNVVVAYWARMSACNLALRLVPGKKSAETVALINSILIWLESTKKANSDNEGITNDTTAQALIEEYALQLFEYGDQQDNAEIFNKNTVKTFYTAGLLMDILDQFGPIPEDIREKRKYAKWKAAYIHNCLKAGQTPLPGPPRALNDNSTGIVHNSTLSAEELASYKKYDGPLPPGINPTEQPSTPPVAPADDLGLNFPKPEDDFGHVPAPSPVTPSVPQDSFTPAPMSPIIPQPPSTTLLPAEGGPVALSPAQIQKAQKFCKFATSALNYDDVKSAVENLHKALNMLQLGREE